MISYVGYKEQAVVNLSISSGKEISLEIELEESILEIGEVVIRPESGKNRPLIEMALISARSFTMPITAMHYVEFLIRKCAVETTNNMNLQHK